MVYLKLNGQDIANALEAIGWSSGSNGGGTTVVSSTTPQDGAIGDLWFNTTDSTLNIYNGTNWSVVSTGGGSGGDISINSDYLTPTPDFTINPLVVEENQVATCTISNYEAGTEYYISLSNNGGTVGEVNASGTFTYIAPDITDTQDKLVTITVSAYKAGFLRSEEHFISVQIKYVPMVADDVLANVNFQDNASYNDGMEFL